MTTHTTTTGDHPTETPWPIDHFNPTTGHGHRQRVLIEAEVYDDPDPECDEPEDRFYALAISTGFERNPCELVSIREGHVRNVVRRIPEPETPGRVVAKRAHGFEVQVLGEWRLVRDVDNVADGLHEAADRYAYGPMVRLHLGGDVEVTLDADAMIPARLPRETS